MVIQSAVAVWLTQRETGYSSSVLCINSLGAPEQPWSSLQNAAVTLRWPKHSVREKEKPLIASPGL